MVYGDSIKIALTTVGTTIFDSISNRMIQSPVGLLKEDSPIDPGYPSCFAQATKQALGHSHHSRRAACTVHTDSRKWTLLQEFT